MVRTKKKIREKKEPLRKTAFILIITIRAALIVGSPLMFIKSLKRRTAARFQHKSKQDKKNKENKKKTLRYTREKNCTLILTVSVLGRHLHKRLNTTEERERKEEKNEAQIDRLWCYDNEISV